MSKLFNLGKFNFTGPDYTEGWGQQCQSESQSALVYSKDVQFTSKRAPIVRVSVFETIFFIGPNKLTANLWCR